LEDNVQIPSEVNTRIVVADDQPLVRAGVCNILSCNPTWHICGEAGDGEEVVEKVRNLKPDVIVLDIRMPVMDGIAAARKIRQISPATKILIFSMDDGEQVYAEVRQAGADGIRLKDGGSKFFNRCREASGRDEDARLRVLTCGLS
jgi:DNA-binding NarL/FixJ family response regulator